MQQLDENASAAWLASTVNRKMPAAALEGVDIGATARRAQNPQSLQSLRVEGHLMYGVAALVAQKTHLLASRTGRTRRELERELGADPNLLEAAATTTLANAPTQTQTIEIISSDFSLDRVMDEFRPSQLSQGSDEIDFEPPSIDDELRGEIDDELRGDDQEMVAPPDMLSEGDEQILRGILEDTQQPEVELDADMEMAAADQPFGEPVELDIPATPPSASTPPGSPLRTKAPRTRKKRLCPVDDRTTITRPTRAPASVIGSRTEEQAQAESLDDDFFDPVRIADSIKRRRLVDIPSDVPELEHSEVDISVAGISMDGLMDDMDDYEYENDNDAPAMTQDVVGSILEPENLEDLMAQEIQAARRTIKDFGAGKLSDIAASSQRSRAALFSEALALATMGEISLEQEAPYQEIMLLSI